MATTQDSKPETENRKQATGNRTLATVQLRTAAESLRACYGDKRVDGFLRAVDAANPLAETVLSLTKDVDALLKLEPPEQMVTDVTRLIDRLYEDGLDRIIAQLSATKIAIAMMKRNEEFVISLMDMFKELSETSALLFMGALGDQPFRELLYFSEQGLHDWVGDGKKRFTSESGVNISEFYRYCTMCQGYDEVTGYKISESAVFLDDVQASLTIFAQQKFNRRLVAMKSRSHVPHVQEQDLISVYLPDHVDYHPEKSRNERQYFMTTLHEGSHIEKGSFVLEIMDMAAFLRERGLVIKRIEFRGEEDKRIKAMIIDKEGKEYLCTSMFHLIPLLGGEGHAPFIKHVWNILEDLRMDSGWIEEKAPGYREDYRESVLDFLKEHRELPAELSASGFVEGLCQVCVLLSASEDRAGFIQALRARVVPDGNDEQSIGHLLGMDPEVLGSVLQFEDVLLELCGARERHGTLSFLKTFEMYDQIKHLLENEQTNDIGENGKNLEGMSGPLSLSDLDPENVELSMDPGQGIDLDDLPEDIKKKLKKKLDQAFPEMSEEDMDNLANKAAGRVGEPQEPKQDAPQTQVPGKWNVELVDGVEVRDYCDVRTVRLDEGAFEGDEDVALNIRNSARMLMRRKLIETSDGLYGEIDPIEKREWRRMRRRGMILPRLYHIEGVEAYSRSISILLIGDASGSTRDMLNGKRKIDYITGSVHSLAQGLDGIPGISSAYGFFNSWGRNSINLYLGKDFNDPVRFAGTEPDDANRDGAMMRKAGELLSRCRTEAKLALFVLDSMPADTDEYNGRRGVEDVRHALTELKRNGIRFFVVTVPPDKRYYEHSEFSSMEEYLNFLYLERKNYALIKSVKELDRAFAACVKGILPDLRRRRRI